MRMKRAAIFGGATMLPSLRTNRSIGAKAQAVYQPRAGASIRMALQDVFVEARIREPAERCQPASLPAGVSSAASGVPSASSISSVNSRSSMRSALPDVLIASSYIVTSLGQLTTK